MSARCLLPSAGDDVPRCVGANYFQTGSDPILKADEEVGLFNCVYSFPVSCLRGCSPRGKQNTGLGILLHQWFGRPFPFPHTPFFPIRPVFRHRLPNFCHCCNVTLSLSNHPTQYPEWLWDLAEPPKSSAQYVRPLRLILPCCLRRFLFA